MNNCPDPYLNITLSFVHLQEIGIHLNDYFTSFHFKFEWWISSKLSIIISSGGEYHQNRQYRQYHFHMYSRIILQNTIQCIYKIVYTIIHIYILKHIYICMYINVEIYFFFENVNSIRISLFVIHLSSAALLT